MAHQADKENQRVGMRPIWRVLMQAFAVLAAGAILTRMGPASAQDLMPIGQIQGRGDASAYVDQRVRFRGIVTGVLEDENASGTRFYTVFVQDVPGGADGDPLTSDGLALFTGARRPALAVGDIAIIEGYVTEFYGLTELDNNGLTWSIESRSNPLPDPMTIDPPLNNDESATFLERYEGMLVSVPVATVVGPSHAGCGFSVVNFGHGAARVIVRSPDDPAGQIVGALHPSDVNCDEMPALGTGDEVLGLNGPLTYHFDRFKIVYQDPSELSNRPADRNVPALPPTRQSGQLLVATFNVNDYFDGEDDTGNDSEPKPSNVELSLKQAKIAATIAQGLDCPDLIGLQEVENETLLSELARRMAENCGFVYQISHLDSPDARGSDVALMSNPGCCAISNLMLRQTCSVIVTDVVDPSTDCPEGQQPLFSRPPLQVELVANDQPIVILVNHFKSKRGGAAETAERRQAQAAFVNGLVQGIYQSAEITELMVIGDFNDYDGSKVMRLLQGQDDLVDGLKQVPNEERYSYIFDGSSQLIDWILVSPSLADRVVAAGIIHSNADYPLQLSQNASSDQLMYRSSDHDVPYMVIDLGETVTSELPEPLHPTLRADVSPTARATADVKNEESVAVADELVNAASDDQMTSESAPVESVADEQDGQEAESPAAPGGIPSQAAPFRGSAVLILVGLFTLAVGVLLLAVVVRRRAG